MSWACIDPGCDMVSENGPGKCQCGADLVEEVRATVADLMVIAEAAVLVHGHSVAISAAVCVELSVRESENLAACFAASMEQAATFIVVAHAYRERLRQQRVAQGMN